MSVNTNALMRAGSGAGGYSGGENWHNNENNMSVPEASGQHSMRAVVGAVLHFFGNQMTSPRPQEAMAPGSMVQRSDGYHDAPLAQLPSAWLEAKRAA